MRNTTLREKRRRERKKWFYKKMILYVFVNIFFIFSFTLFTHHVFKNTSTNSSKDTIVFDTYAQSLELNQNNDVVDSSEIEVIDVEETSEVTLNEEDVEEEVVDEVELEEEVEDEESENFYYDIPLSNNIQDFIYEMSEKYDVEVELILAVIEQESNFDSNCRSTTNDTGLMQINDINLDELKENLNITNLYDPYQNIEAGTYFLKKCLDAANNELNPALMCYNFGIGGARELWKEGIYSSQYSRDIVAKYKKYCES
jgi:hypothetical protein